MKRKLRNSSFPVEYHRNKSESKKNIVVVSKYSCLRCDLRPPYKSIWRTHGIRYRQLLVFKIHVMERVGSWTFPPKCHWVKNPKLQFIWTKNFKVWGGSHWRHKYDKYFHSEFHQKQLTNIFIPWIYPPPTNITTRTFTFLDNVAALVSFITGFGVGPDGRRRSLSPMWDWDSKLPFTIDGQFRPPKNQVQLSWPKGHVSRGRLYGQLCKKDWELPAIFAKLMGSCCLCTTRTRCKPGLKKSYNSASEKVNVLSGGGCVNQPYSGHWHTGRGRSNSSPKKHVIQRSNTTWILTGKHHCPLLFPIEWCSIRTVLGKKYWALDFCHGWIEWDMAKRAFTVGKSSSLYVHLFLSGFFVWYLKLKMMIFFKICIDVEGNIHCKA